MKRMSTLVCLALPAWALLWASPAVAHFQVLVPSNDTVSPDEDRTITLDIRFTHPVERGPVMNMGEPAQFGVLVRGERIPLEDTLHAVEFDGARAFTAEYTLKRPGAHVFYLQPAPYWEAGERAMIVHYTKVVVDAFGAWSGWDEPVGFPVEIMPLTRPYGLWTGNVFQGVVTRDGKPVPGAHVEVEYLNDDGAVTPPAGAFVTQVVRADANGVFTYAMPRAGWWGFAALVENDETAEGPDGEPAQVEQGAVIWVRAVDMDTRDAAE